MSQNPPPPGQLVVTRRHPWCPQDSASFGLVWLALYGFNQVPEGDYRASPTQVWFRGETSKLTQVAAFLSNRRWEKNDHPFDDSDHPVVRWAIDTNLRDRDFFNQRMNELANTITDIRVL